MQMGRKYVYGLKDGKDEIGGDTDAGGKIFQGL